ncbi:MAG: uroporphyrinogen decarboxylase [Chloroflexota bacterium]
MRGTMTSRERLQAAITGTTLDHPPVALWRHFPEVDQTASGLAEATIAWQKRFSCDLVKFMPPGDYPIIDWGGASEYQGSRAGTRTTTRFPVTDLTDWAKLRPIDVHHGFNAVVLEALAITRARLDPAVPLFQTIFSPLTIAMKLSNGRAVNDLRADPAAMHAALRVITEVTTAMLRASEEAGADGIFFATQCADERVMTNDEYQTFGLPYDLEVLQSARPATMILLHLHGERPMFALQAYYPAAIVNWHDRHAGPSLTDGQRQSSRCVAGGLNERAIATRTASEVATEAEDALAATGGRRHLLAPGCVIPIDTPEENILAAIAAARHFTPAQSLLSL